jgi:hypothetical protein
MIDALSAELKAMAQVEAALKGLAEDEQSRVMQWAISRFRGGIALVDSNTDKRNRDGQLSNSAESVPATESSDDFPTFYDAASPKTDPEKALVCAYWLQYKEGASDVEAQRVNTSLKHLGHGVSNITRAFEGLKSQKPALIVQTRKEGTSQQARKKFKVTAEGKKTVERMLNRSGTE